MNDKEAIFQKKTIDAAVNTIMTKMEELYGASDLDKEITKRRWIWELMQNANDCACLEKITIWIKSNNNQLIFSHNGEAFTYDNMIDLITQISSKRSNEEKMGKFGTGFISTHLISNVIKIKGIYHENQTSSNYKSMEVDIDRSGKTESEIKESIVNVINKMDEMDKKENIELINDKDKTTTSFIYNLDNKSENIKEFIKAGFNDLDKCIAFVLVFAKSIEEVHCNGITYRINDKLQKLTEELEIINVEKVYDNTKLIKNNKVLICTDKTHGVSIATLIKEDQGQYCMRDIRNLPKIFCTFPLMGTEKFSFPVVLNCSKFKVLQERNNIQEGSEENKQIIDIGIKLYKNLIEYLGSNGCGNLYNICYINNTHKTTLQSDIETKITEIYSMAPIVDVEDRKGRIIRESLLTCKNDEILNNVIIPYIKQEELGDELWALTKSLDTKLIPCKSSYKYWSNVYPNLRVGLYEIYDFFIKEKTIAQLSEKLIGGRNIIEWLNSFYDLWIKSKNECNLNITAAIPNQNNKFTDIKRLSIDNNIDNNLKEILISLGVDIREKLIHKDLKLISQLKIEIIDNEYIADEISKIVRKQLSSENSGVCKRSIEVQNIFNRLTDWFLKNPKLGRELFKDIYDMQHLLSSPGETIRRLELANTIESSMSKNNIEVEQLQIILNESGKLLQMFEDGRIQLSDDAKQLFNHISSKSIYAKERLESLINRSIKNVYNELLQNPLYVVDNTLEKWKESSYSRTVFRAEKEDREIRIVIRPSDDNKIIFYEDTELEALDDTDYELWTDDGNGMIRMITLGDLIKTTGISVIPLSKVI